jgi:hypothetical protein
MPVTKATTGTGSKPATARRTRGEERKRRKGNTFRQLAATNPCAHWTAMKKLRLHQAVK